MRDLDPIQRWSRQTLALAVVVIASLVVTAALHLAPIKPNITVFNHIDNAPTLDTFADSWSVMHAALQQVQQKPDAPLYQKVFFEQDIKFQYPPSSLLVMEWLWALPGVEPGTYWIFDALSLIAVALLIPVVIRIDETATGRLHPNMPAPSSVMRWARRLSVALAVLTFYPLTRSFALGQIQTWLTLGAAWVILFWLQKRHWSAGVIVGMMCAIKPQYALLLLWGALRKQGALLAAGLTTAGAVALISVRRFGLAKHLQYFNVLSFLSRHGEAFHPNQSVNGLMNRLLGLGSNLNWTPHAFPEFHPLVYITTLSTSLLLIGFALFWRGRRASTGGPYDLAGMMLTLTIASPIAWEHHYAVLLPVFAAMLAAFTASFAPGRPWTILFIIAYGLSSLHLSTTHMLADRWTNVLQSYLLFAGLATLPLLCRFESKTSGTLNRPVCASEETSYTNIQKS